MTVLCVWNPYHELFEMTEHYLCILFIIYAGILLTHKIIISCITDIGAGGSSNMLNVPPKVQRNRTDIMSISTRYPAGRQEVMAT